jgi:NADPH:quinone reductase-like Zn-dependent oxidoreductase
MKAIVIKDFGSAEVLQLDDVEKPQITDDQILVKIAAAGLNPVDTKIRAGKHLSCKDLRLPAILGKDMSGVVESVGKNLNSFRQGDAVFGCVDKTYAEYAAVNPEAVVLKPENVSFEEASAVSLAGLTAYQAIHEQLGLLPGQHILIQSAAGGVGHLAVQFAKLAGAVVSGTASGKNLEFLKILGVDVPINYKEEKFEELVAPDVVLDSMGGEVLYRSIGCVKRGGSVVCLPSSTKDDPKALALAREKGVKLSWFMMKPKQDTLQLIADLMKAEKLHVDIDRIFQMQEIVEAHKAIESHGTRGKIVVRINALD